MRSMDRISAWKSLTSEHGLLSGSWKAVTSEACVEIMLVMNDVGDFKNSDIPNQQLRFVICSVL
jgi:hypothetical protein